MRRVSLLHVLVIAPMVALCAGVSGSAMHVFADSAAPQPVAVAIDPGHGGSPSASNPSQPFDPGTIGVNGLLEKDVTLDVSLRLAALLRADDVNVALTRTGDTSPDVNQREQVAINAHADVFVSIHCNSYSDPPVGGSLVLYPTSASLAFAQTLSDALASGLARAQVAADGVQLRDNWWTHAPMPTSTVEIAYLSNPREAALLATPQFRELAAEAIRDGIERYDPRILQRKAEISAWDRAHAATPAASPTTAHVTPAQHVAPPNGGSPLPVILMWMLLIGITAAAVRRRDVVIPVLRTAGAYAEALFAQRPLRHAAARRRRRRVRVHARTQPQRWAPRSVYDDLSF